MDGSKAKQLKTLPLFCAALGGGPHHFFTAASKHLLGQKLLQLRILLLQRLQPLGLGDIHAAEFGLPILDRRLGDTVLASQIGRRRPGLMLSTPQ